jgi:hypothetical protein
MTDWKDLAGAVRTGPGDSSKRTRALLEALVAGFASQCRRYHEATDDHAFAYRERQVHSALFPALREITATAFLEQPADRGKPRLGRVDYWFIHGDREHFCEVKHGYARLGTQKAVHAECTAWTKMLDQLRALEGAHADPGDVLLGLHLIVHFADGDVRGREGCSRDACWDRHRNLGETLGTGDSAPTWDALWMVPEDMQVGDVPKGMDQTYPAISIFAWRRKVKVNPTEAPS